MGQIIVDYLKTTHSGIINLCSNVYPEGWSLGNMNRSELKQAAIDFLDMLSSFAIANFRGQTWIQKSEWMVKRKDHSYDSRVFERKVSICPAHELATKMNLFSKITPRTNKLEQLLLEAGISKIDVSIGYLIPLINYWLSTTDAYDVRPESIGQLLDDFCEAVMNKKIIIESRDALIQLSVDSVPLQIQEGIHIRNITEEELWELGDKSNYPGISLAPSNISFMVPPSEDLKILQIKIPYRQESSFPTNVFDFPPNLIHTMRNAVFAGLVVSSPGYLIIQNLGVKANYSVGSSGILIEPSHREFYWGTSYNLTEQHATKLKKVWPQLYRIVSSKKHLLRLATERLLDGATRNRNDDAIIDYAIGLEALLTGSIKDELNYRFALRGATILTWESGNKTEAFERFKNFYEIRSRIVHGNYVGVEVLKQNREFGDVAIRKILWWFFERDQEPRKALDDVDRRILSC